MCFSGCNCWKDGINRAALEFNVPNTMLKYHEPGRIVHGTNMGMKVYLMNKEEEELVDFLLNCAKMGYAKTRQDVLKMVHNAVLERGEKKVDEISYGWWVCFCKRWSRLRLCKGD